MRIITTQFISHAIVFCWEDLSSCYNNTPVRYLVYHFSLGICEIRALVSPSSQPTRVRRKPRSKVVSAKVRRTRQCLVWWGTRSSWYIRYQSQAFDRARLRLAETRKPKVIQVTNRSCFRTNTTSETPSRLSEMRYTWVWNTGRYEKRVSCA